MFTSKRLKVLAANRDVIQEIRNDALNNSFDILLVFMFDRLGRIESETPFVLEWFVNHGIEMWSTREGQQKIETHDDKLINYLRFWQAAGESEKISTRIRTRVRQIVSSGHYAGGTVPFGYQAVYHGRKNKKDMPVKDLEIQPDEAEIVQEIFYMVAQEGNEFIGWAEEFELAPIARKRMILSQLLTKVELGTKYAVTVEINMSYKQFLEMDSEQGSKVDIGA